MSTGSFALRDFICFLKAAILREVLEEDLIQYSSAFQVCPFNMLIHQNEHMGSGLWSLLIGWHYGRGSLVNVPGPDVSHGGTYLDLQLFWAWS